MTAANTTQGSCTVYVADIQRMYSCSTGLNDSMTPSQSVHPPTHLNTLSV